MDRIRAAENSGTALVVTVVSDRLLATIGAIAVLVSAVLR